MGFFSNVGNKVRAAALQTTWFDTVVPLRKLISQRGLVNEYKQSVQTYFEEAIEASRYESIKGQIKASKSSHVYAFSIKDSNIVDSCALYTVSIYVEVFCRLYPEKQEGDDLVMLYAPLFQELEGVVINSGAGMLAIDLKKIIAPQLFK